MTDEVSHLSEQLVGTWSLVSYKVTDEKGNETYPLGEDAEGLALYNEGGYMSVQIMQSNRLSYAGGDLHRGPEKAVAAAARGYLAYSGTYKIDKEQRLVEHTMSVSLNPNWTGDTQPRYMKVEEDHLTISSQPVYIKGQEQNTELIWKKL